MSGSAGASTTFRQRLQDALSKLAREHSSTPRLSAAVATGAFIGSTPLFGFHTAIGVLVSRLFHLNSLAVITGTQVSLPFFAPFIVIMSLQLGHFVLQGEFMTVPTGAPPLELGQRYLSAWVIGSVGVGSALAAVSYFASFIALRRWRGPESSQNGWDGTSRGTPLAYRAFYRVTRYTPPLLARALARVIAFYFLLLSPKARRASRTFFHQLRGPKSWLDELRDTYQQLALFAVSLVDRLHLSMGRAEHYRFERDGWHHLEEARAQGKGVIIAAAHFGAWSVGGQILRGGIVPTLVVWAHEADRMRAFFAEHQKVAPKIIAINSGPTAVIEVLKALRNQELVCLLADRVAPKSPSLDIDFLGRPAQFPLGPFHLAAASGAPLLASFNHKTSPTTVQLFLRKAPDSETLSRNERTEQLARWYAAELESVVRRYPHQWYNFFDYWAPEPPQ